jgi:tetratricopeptide (TPR) repeat protein
VAKVLPLPSRFHAALFLLVVSVPAAVLAGVTVRVVAAQMLADSSETSQVERAVALDPDNAEFHYRLGILYLAGAGGPAAAIASLRKATELSPEHADYWLGLAEGCYVGGDASCAAQGFERAIRLAPMRPGMEWEAASYYAATSQRDKALAHLRRLLALSPEGADEVFPLTWRAFDDPAMVWQKLIAPSHNISVECAYLDFLGERNRFDLTGAEWAKLLAAGGESRGAGRMAPMTGKPQRMTFPEVKPYLQRLLNAQQYEQAAGVWRDLLRLGVIPPASGGVNAAAFGPAPAAGNAPLATVSGNLIYNGSFAQPCLNAGFGWQTRQEEFLTLDRGDVLAKAGAGDGPRVGLRIDFTVPNNAEHEPIYQFVPVVPGQRYVLKAYLRSEDITSDSGPRLRVIDPRHPQDLDAATEGVTGTTPWHATSVEFTAAATPVVRVSIWRPRSRSFPMDISGRAWIGDVTLQAIR